MHYQAYLLEGIAPWNADRGRAAVEGDKLGETGHCNVALRHEVNRLSNLVYGQAFDTKYKDPGKYTGQYLNLCLKSLHTIASAHDCFT